jgi:1-pyrroline-5-carboxylate dehydrogenase
VDARVYDEFVEKLKQRVMRMRVGSPEDPANYMGPVISAGAKKTIEEYIEIGRKEGSLLTGAAADDSTGYFVAPTVIVDVDSKARIFQEEIFGPVLAVAKARDFDHAMEMANDSQYGLTGSIYSTVPAHIERAREELFVGNMYINRKCTGAMVGAHPFGGFNMSGTDSKAGGPDYLLLFLQAKSIAERVEKSA